MLSKGFGISFGRPKKVDGRTTIHLLLFPASTSTMQRCCWGGSASQFIEDLTGASPGGVPSLLRKDYLPAGRSERRESTDEISRGRVWNPDDQWGRWWHNAPSRTANSASNREEAQESTSPNEADTSSHQLWTQLAAVKLWSVLF